MSGLSYRSKKSFRLEAYNLAYVVFTESVVFQTGLACRSIQNLMGKALVCSSLGFTRGLGIEFNPEFRENTLVHYLTRTFSQLFLADFLPLSLMKLSSP